MKSPPVRYYFVFDANDLDCVGQLIFVSYVVVLRVSVADGRWKNDRRPSLPPLYVRSSL